MRLFVAADVPDDARALIAAEQTRMAAALPGMSSGVKWVKAAHSHLTLVFLGNVEDAGVPAVIDAVGRDVEIAPFDMVVEGAGVFPARGAPRVLWLGITQGAREVTQLQRELATRVAALGVALEDRPFHPHLTLARWKESRSADRDRALAAARPGPIATAHIAGATLYQSRLSPSGPEYTALAHANLVPR
jgi:2'-5' RNA ligase